eukprot:g10821.t1
MDKTINIKNVPKPFGIHKFKHDGSVRSVTFSNDGSLLATGDCAGKTIIYDVKSKTKINEFKHDDGVWSVSFSPDGGLLATGDGANKTTIYDVKSKTKVDEFIHDGLVYCVSFSPDGSLLATGDFANKTTIYDVKSKTKIHEFIHDGEVLSLSFSNDGSLLATGDCANKTIIYDVISKTKKHEFKHDIIKVKGTAFHVKSVSFSNDGVLLATGGGIRTDKRYLKGKTTIYNVMTNAKIYEVKHNDVVNSVSFSHDGTLLATGEGEDRKLREDPRECKLGKTIIYDVKSKTKIHEFKHDGSVFSVSLSKDGTLLATGDDYQKKDEGKTIIYDLKSEAKIHEFEHSHFVHDVSFSNVGSLLATGDGDSKTGKTTIFDVVTKTKIHEFKHDGLVHSVEFSNNGSLLATGDCAGKTVIYDVKSKIKIYEVKHDGPVNSVSFSPDGRLLATGDHANKTIIYDVKSKTRIHDFIHDGRVMSVSFSPDGRLLATGDIANKTTIYDVKSKTKIHEFEHVSGAGGVWDVSFSPDGSLLATGDSAAKLTIYDIKTKTKIFEINNGKTVLSVAFSNNGLLLATSDTGNNWSMYDFKSKAKIHEFTHHGFVRNVAFSNDDFLFATADSDRNTATIYTPQLAHPGDVLLSGIKPLTVQNSSLLYRPCPTTHTTFLHRCVEEGDSNLLQEIQSNIVMKQDKNKRTPLDIAIQQKSHQKCLLLVKACFSTPNNYSHDTLVQSIPKLIEEKYHDVVECIFENIMIKTETSELERFSLPQPLFRKYIGIGSEKLFKGKTNSTVVEVQTYQILDASGLILLWIGIFNKIRGFEKFSVLITTFTQILYDIRYFTIMLAVIICAFAMAFKLLVHGQGIFNNFVAIESTYNLMFGLTNLDIFVDYDDNKISIAARFFVSFFLFLVVIVMFNMLIAIMADSFDNVQANLKIQSFRSKAKVCADLLIDFRPTHHIFKEQYLHICTVRDEAGENAIMNSQSQWEGRLKAVKKEIQDVKAEMKADMGEISAKIDKLMEALIKN